MTQHIATFLGASQTTCSAAQVPYTDSQHLSSNVYETTDIQTSNPRWTTPRLQNNTSKPPQWLVQLCTHITTQPTATSTAMLTMQSKPGKVLSASLEPCLPYKPICQWLSYMTASCLTRAPFTGWFLASRFNATCAIVRSALSEPYKRATRPLMAPGVCPMRVWFWG